MNWYGWLINEICLNMKNQMKITLLIDDRRYPLVIKEEDEQRYREAAILIDKALYDYRRTWVELPEELNYYAMAALELAYKYLLQKEEAE